MKVSRRLAQIGLGAALLPNFGVMTKNSRGKLFADLADAAEKQASIWADRMRSKGSAPPWLATGRRR